MQRVFIVGCPRSGTTFVQALLARHPDVLTFPETAFFEELYGNLAWRWSDADARRRWRWRQRLGFARSDGRRTLAALRRQWLPVHRLDFVPWRTERCIRSFIELLDGRAQAAGKTLWIEKTPNHLLYIPEIEAHVPDARFVHVIRRGEEVLASIADASLRYASMSAFGGGMARWSQRWNRAAMIHRDCAGRPRHAFVFLDDLVRDAADEWCRLCAFLGLDPAAPLGTSQVRSIADLHDEPWKREAVSGQPRTPRGKAEAMFGPEARAWFRSQLLPYDELHNSLRPGRRTFGAEVRQLIRRPQLRP